MRSQSRISRIVHWLKGRWRRNTVRGQEIKEAHKVGGSSCRPFQRNFAIRELRIKTTKITTAEDQSTFGVAAIYKVLAVDEDSDSSLDHVFNGCHNLSPSTTGSEFYVMGGVRRAGGPHLRCKRGARYR